MTEYLNRAEKEIARLYAENGELRAENENERLKEQNYLTVLNANQIEMKRLRTENIQLKNEMMSREIERLTGDRFEFHGELGDKVPALTKDEASLLVLRGALHAATAEVGKLRADNERLRELLGGCCDWIEENHTWLDAPYCLTVGRAELKQGSKQ